MANGMASHLSLIWTKDKKVGKPEEKNGDKSGWFDIKNWNVEIDQIKIYESEPLTDQHNRVYVFTKMW